MFGKVKLGYTSLLYSLGENPIEKGQILELVALKKTTLFSSADEFY